MADNYLLVPMQLDVMVMNKAAVTATPFLRFGMEYENLQSFNSPEPRPFTANLPQPDAGIYLHWTLPKSLRHGVHKGDGSTEFPLIPNRWLIARMQGGAAPGQAVKAWILESDYLDQPDGKTPGSSPYIDPGGLSGQGTPKPTKIGRALRLKPELKSLPAQAAPFLKALGPGSVTFSIYSPGVDNVLSFYDDVTADDDTTTITGGTFSYTVIGWYSDAAHDPLGDVNLEWAANTDSKLQGTYVLQWKKEIDPKLIKYSFDWYVYAAKPKEKQIDVEARAASLPKKMLVHTLVSGVAWARDSDNTPATNYPNDISNNVKVSIGNTAIDALGGIVRLDKNSQTEADLLEAFQYGLLDKFDEPGSAEALNMAIRERWFGASPGGTLWTVVAQQRADNTALPAPPVPTTNDAQRKALADLNAQQYELDRQQRLLESMQWNLFSLWWKNNWQLYNSVPDNDLSDWLTQLPLEVGVGSSCVGNPVGTDPDKESWYICKVMAQRNLVAKLTSDVSAATTALTALVHPDHLELKAINMPQYYYPNDPVVLVTGLGRSTNFDPTEGLLCRLPSQTVTALTVGGTTYSANSSGGTNIQNQIPVLNDPNNLLPGGVQQLHTESFFLSPCLFAKASLGDTTACPPPAGTTDTLADGVRAAIKDLPAASVGGQFAPISFSREEWVQPWVPLLLDWQVTVLKDPAYTCVSGADGTHQLCTFNQCNWQFDGTDYKWTGTTSAGGGNFDESASLTMQLTGRTFITPHLTHTLADQLDDYVNNHKMRDLNLEELLEDLDKYIDAIAGQDILSQRLSGMMAMMIERHFTQNVAPSGDITNALGQASDNSSRDFRHGYPMPFKDARASYDAPAWDFAPMCGTFFVINGLTVIDSFGRSIDLMLGNYSQFNASQATQGQTSGSKAQSSQPEYYFYPITGRNLKAPTAKDPAPSLGISSNPTERMIQLTPRLVQDSRLEFRLLSNDGKNSEIDRAAGTNPVCGWILPNHLDRSLAVYAPDGTAWGELYLSKHAEDKYIPSWQPDPTNKQAPQSVDAIPNLYVNAMLKTLDERTDEGTGFYDLIQVIDETLWTINPRGQRKDQDLSVLIGRPLAIVRARLTLQLRGLPFYNQDWWNTFDVDPANQPDTQAAPLGAFHGGVFKPLWPVRVGSQSLRDDGVIGYYLDDPVTPANNFKSFHTVNLPAEIKTDYLKQIGQDNYIQLRFVDDTVSAPDHTQNQVCDITMLVDPRGQIHAFTGLLPVVTLHIPNEFVTPALQKMYYLFRAGPFLTSPDEVRIPRPAERQGTWTWFDYVLNSTTNLTQADAKVRLTVTPPLVKEGWLKFTPNPPQDGD